MRKAITALLGSSILFTSGAALAQYQTGGQYQTGTGGTYQPAYTPAASGTDNIGGREMQFVFGVDRVMGVFANSLKAEPDGGGSSTTTSTDIALFGNVASLSSMPRLALDFFPIEGLSLGGSLVYWRSSGETELESAAGASVTSDSPTVSLFLIHPRVGWSFVIDETFAVWPRAGIIYGNRSIESTETDPTTGASQDTTISFSTLALSLDVPVVISPIENFAILIGPFVDFGVSGSTSVETDPAPAADPPDTDTKLTTFGLSVGIAGYY
jgi:hypothetical protein